VDPFSNFITGTVTLFSDPLGILIFFGGVVGGMLFGLGRFRESAC